MGNTSGTTRGTPSLQQLARLRDERAHGRFASISNLFTVPEAVGDELFRERLTRVVRREEALRIVDGSLEDGGWIDYAADVAVPLDFRFCDSEEEMSTLARELAGRTFERVGSALWAVTVIGYRARNGRPARAACTVFDHFVTDGHSMHLLQKELSQAPTARPRHADSRYRDWVDWQRTRFPVPDTRPSSHDRDFWHLHLAGTGADRPTRLPFATLPEPGAPGEITSMNLALPVTAAGLRARAQMLGISPFLVVLASFAATVSGLSGATDLTFRVIVGGRPTDHLNRLGWFADSVPLRLAHPELADPLRSVAEVNARWSEVLAHQTTPLDYIRAACPPSPEHEIDPARRRMQLVLNFVPQDLGGMYSEEVPELTVPGDIDGLHLTLLPGPDQRLRLGAMFNPGAFPKQATHDFLQHAIDDLAELVKHPR
ncbi:condensation domain-containing protein [Kitasatospora sp. MAP5-34]|uniref:condensation domain-containing protein n=1 Tax=Kitasatospora sp. MAP5-34 TaxID=3035102 RepID=UPI002476D259|nr:condensation domain-containing protein [Kitasatospora sp. MAP5-34]MDH6575307.1 hypothetical protein [Kitasatospora sp. MAP5-34]